VRRILCLLLVGAACSRRLPHDRAPERHEATSTSVVLDAGLAQDPVDAGAANEPAALEGYPALVELGDGKEKLGVVGVPLGARQRRPLMVALHGGSERPERACEAWRAVVDGYAFVVCPRGFGGNERRLGWRGAEDASARIARAVTATKKAFAAWVNDAPTFVLAGFSMGASQVALLAGRSPQTYRRLAIGDAAHDPRSALTFSKTWSGGGGERVVFFCTTSGCEPSMRAAARNVARDGARARLNVAPTQRHAFSDRVAESLRRDWRWLVEGVEGWESYAPAVDTALPGTTETFGPK
jgi:hypothetical protein